MALFNIVLTPTLSDEIIAAQKNNDGMDHMKRRMQDVTCRSLVSARMRKGPYGSKKGWLCQGKKLSRRRFWMKPIR
jgi:hypothetical protein